MPSAWFRLDADDFSAVVSTSHLGTIASSHLANIIDLELHAEGPNTPNVRLPCVRLDCSADVAKEVVAVLRQGRCYVPPTDRRLLKAVHAQLDYLGIGAGSSGSTCHYSLESQEVVLVPSYMKADRSTKQKAGLLLYSSKTKGWANKTGSQDPRPQNICMEQHSDGYRGSRMLTAVLRAESTGAGEDMVYMVPNDFPATYGETAVLLKSSLQCSCFSMPPQHKPLYSSAMCAARGRLYLLGGTHMGWPEPPVAHSPFEIYDPHMDSWFTTSPLPGKAQISGHCMVTNQNEGMLLALGGWREQHDPQLYQFMNDHIYMYDVTGGSWTVNPSGCRFPRAADAGCVSALATDPFTILVLSADHTTKSAAAVDLLDLRTWRWREGPQLERQSKCLQSMGVVVYDSKVLALGGSSGEGPLAVSREVHAYDPRTESWSELPALPFGVCGASPVVVNMPSAMQ